MKGKGMSYFGRISFPFFFILIFFSCSFSSFADVIINVLAVNGADKAVEKEIEFSLPGEIAPDDVLDSAGLTIDYNSKDAGYYLHGKVNLLAKETRTMKVRVRDVWKITPQQIDEIIYSYKTRSIPLLQRLKNVR